MAAARGARDGTVTGGAETATAPARTDARRDLLLAALAFAANLPALAGGFLWDDHLWLRDSTITPHADGWWRAWTHGAHFDWYPLTSDAFWILWRLFGEAPFGYHVASLALHALGAMILARVLAALAVPGAWWIAALWAAHPVNVATVAWIAELKNTLSFPLYAGAALLWIRSWDGDAGRRGALATALHGASLLAKSAGVGLPVALGLLAWARGRPLAREARRLAPMALLSTGAGIVTLRFQVEGAIGSAAGDVARPLAARIADAGAAVAFYAAKALAPVGLAIVYPRAEGGGAAAWASLALVAAGLAALFALRGRIGRAPFAAAASYVVLLAPILGFVDTYYRRWSDVADHWQYHALPWLLALVGAAAALAARRAALPARARTAVAGVALGACVVLAFAQARAYVSPRAFWEKVLAHDPGSALGHAELGVQLARAGDAAAAEEHLRRAIEADPADGFAPNNLGRVLEGQGRLEDAAEAYRTAATRAPALVSARGNLGRVLARLGRAEEAEGELRAAIAADPRYVEPRLNLAQLFLESGRPDSARAHLEEGVRVAPASPDARRMLAQFLVRGGDLAGAAVQMREVVALAPEDEESRAVLAALEQAMAKEPAAPDAGTEAAPTP